MINPTPPGKLKEFLIGDLQVAMRHCHRILYQQLPPSRGIIIEVLNSVNDCIERIERDLK